MRRLVVVSVAYPFSPVAPEAVGGAEQVLGMIDDALVRGGHRSIVVAAAGSRCAGELVSVPVEPGTIGDDRARTHRAVQEATERVVRETGAQLVHLHGVDFAEYLPRGATPVLVTLHLPLSFYPPRALPPDRARTHLCAVSTSQVRGAPRVVARAAVIPNGVPLDRFEPEPRARRRYALWLGRICPEKGLERAIDAARRAAVPVLLAGQVFPYASHQQYFAEVIAPRLGRGCRYVGPVGPRRKARLLARARCLLVASRVAETSSLVAMEALASGTPVVAMRVGALPEIVDDGRTGFLVEDLASMAEAIRRTDAVDPQACRRAAEDRFDSRRMVQAYLDLYRRLLRPAERDSPCSA